MINFPIQSHARSNSAHHPNRLLMVILVLSALLLASCGPSPAEQNAVKATEAWVSLQTLQAQSFPTPTPTPLPTETLPPTPTETPAPGAVVLVNALNVREGPGTDYPQLGQAKKNDELYVLGQFGGCAWLKVQTGDQSLTGWVSGDAQYIELRPSCEAVPPGAFRPLTGVIKPNQRGGGSGEIIIENGTDADGVVILTLDEDPFFAAYVRAGESITLTGITDGTYFLYFSTGSEWNGREFSSFPSRQRFEDAFEFTTSATQYTSWSVTLHGVVGGNAAAEDVPASQFPDLGE